MVLISILNFLILRFLIKSPIRIMYFLHSKTYFDACLRLEEENGQEITIRIEAYDILTQ